MNDSDDLEPLLNELDQADAALRAMYRKLVDEPDLANDCTSALTELRAKRLDLARQVGLRVLAHRRKALADGAIPTSTPSPAATAANEASDAPSAVVESAPVTAEPAEVPRRDGSPTLATEAAVAEWTDAARNGALGAQVTVEEHWTSSWSVTLDELMTLVGPPRDLATSVGLVDELDALDAVASDDRLEQWTRLPKHVQQQWLSMLVARTRVLQQLPLLAVDTKVRVKEMVGRCAAWAKAFTPGHVNGLQLRHAPLDGAWARDVVRHWAALEEIAEAAHPSLPPAAPSTRRAKRAPRDTDDEPAVEPDWPLLPLVRGRKAIIVGGDPREPNRRRLEQTFQFESLEWPPIDGPRKVESVVGRIARGSYGLVMVLQPFVAHAESEPIIDAAKRAETPWALPEGYGVASVKLGLERFLGRRSAARRS